ncbi:hypothetical protein BGX26_005456 [Mortierella sp. AD094]|nr:hypothetical protein BGX26_005456 [Mortierella sp. AD094]
MSSFANDHDEVINDKSHKATWSHELIAGAAAFEAARAYEQHVAQNGKPDSHALAKELFAGFAGIATDRLIETKGLDFIDREKAKHQAKKNAEAAYDEQNLNGGNLTPAKE